MVILKSNERSEAIEFIKEALNIFKGNDFFLRKFQVKIHYQKMGIRIKEQIHYSPMFYSMKMSTKIR